MGSVKSKHRLPRLSKDYVEHTRTVHFSMIAICIALIVIASSRSRTEITEASEQLQLIIESLHSWDPGFLEDAAKRRIAEVNSKQKEALPTSLFVPTPAKADIIFLGPSEDSKSTSLSMKFLNQNWMVKGPIRELVPRGARQAMFTSNVSMGFIDGPYLLISPPGSLAGFRALWDALASTTTIIVPTKLAQTMYTFTIPEEGKWDGNAGSLTLPQRTVRYAISSSAPPRKRMHTDACEDRPR